MFRVAWAVVDCGGFDAIDVTEARPAPPHVEAELGIYVFWPFVSGRYDETVVQYMIVVQLFACFHSLVNNYDGYADDYHTYQSRYQMFDEDVKCIVTTAPRICRCLDIDLTPVGNPVGS